MKYEMIASATFGLEAVVKREISELGLKILKTEDGKVTFLGDEHALVKANLWLRCADRVYIKMGEFEALSFEELFQKTKALNWEDIIPPDGKVIVNGTSVKSQLHSVPAVQSIVQKALSSKVCEFYSTDRLSEKGATYSVRFAILKNRVTISIDTSGVGLHKRGYRQENVEAPIKETLAAAMVKLSFWRDNRILMDPFCGSGTIAIEAAMIGRNLAPGLQRNFISEQWDIIPKEIWREERLAAIKAVKRDVTLNITACDISPKAVGAAKSNAKKAGVLNDIKFINKDAALLDSQDEGGIIITNPPYGERIGEKKGIQKLYKGLESFFANHPSWSCFIITPDLELEKNLFHREADRRRKLYNGRIMVYYYQFHGHVRKLSGEEEKR